jgi:hypothetical protein
VACCKKVDQEENDQIKEEINIFEQNHEVRDCRNMWIVSCTKNGKHKNTETVLLVQTCQQEEY